MSSDTPALPLTDAADLNELPFDTVLPTELTPIRDLITDDFIHACLAEQQDTLSSFLRQKINCQLHTIEFSTPEQLHPISNQTIMHSVLITPDNQQGLVFFDFACLHLVMTLLYGGQPTPNEPIMTQLGKFGSRIALKLAELCITAFQRSLQTQLKIDREFSAISPYLYSFFNQATPHRLLLFSMSIRFETLSSTIHIVMPETLFHVPSDGPQEPLEPTAMTPETMLNKLQESELQTTLVEITASLPEIKLKISDVIDLKAGDLIPIQDPLSVYIALNEKKMFKASAGKVNTTRVVKIISKA